MNITTKTITTVQLSMEEIKEALTEYLMCRGVASEEETTTVQFRSRQRPDMISGVPRVEVASAVLTIEEKE